MAAPRQFRNNNKQFNTLKLMYDNNEDGKYYTLYFYDDDNYFDLHQSNSIFHKVLSNKGLGPFGYSKLAPITRGGFKQVYQIVDSSISQKDKDKYIIKVEFFDKRLYQIPNRDGTIFKERPFYDGKKITDVDPIITSATKGFFTDEGTKRFCIVKASSFLVEAFLSTICTIEYNKGTIPLILKTYGTYVIRNDEDCSNALNSNDCYLPEVNSDPNTIKDSGIITIQERVAGDYNDLWKFYPETQIPNGFFRTERAPQPNEFLAHLIHIGFNLGTLQSSNKLMHNDFWVRNVYLLDTRNSREVKEGRKKKNFNQLQYIKYIYNYKDVTKNVYLKISNSVLPLIADFGFSEFTSGNSFIENANFSNRNIARNGGEYFNWIVDILLFMSSTLHMMIHSNTNSGNTGVIQFSGDAYDASVFNNVAFQRLLTNWQSSSKKAQLINILLYLITMIGRGCTTEGSAGVPVGKGVARNIFFDDEDVLHNSWNDPRTGWYASVKNGTPIDHMAEINKSWNLLFKMDFISWMTGRNWGMRLNGDNMKFFSYEKSNNNLNNIFPFIHSLIRFTKQFRYHVPAERDILGSSLDEDDFGSITLSPSITREKQLLRVNITDYSDNKLYLENPSLLSNTYLKWNRDSNYIYVGENGKLSLNIDGKVYNPTDIKPIDSDSHNCLIVSYDFNNVSIPGLSVKSGFQYVDGDNRRYNTDQINNQYIHVVKICNPNYVKDGKGKSGIKTDLFFGRNTLESIIRDKTFINTRSDKSSFKKGGVILSGGYFKHIHTLLNSDGSINSWIHCNNIANETSTNCFKPIGPVIKDKKLVKLTNSVPPLYKEVYGYVCVKNNESELSVRNENGLKTGNCDDILSSGPILVLGGKLAFNVNLYKKNKYLASAQDTTKETHGYDASGSFRYLAGHLGHAFNTNPRTAIGTDSNKNIYLVTVEGRGSRGAGVDLVRMGEIMKGLGCYNAINLDGGGTSDLLYKLPNSQCFIDTNPTHKYVYPEMSLNNTTAFVFTFNTGLEYDDL